jgi:ribosomal protein S27AE
MPYTLCPTCSLSAFTAAAGHSSRDECHRCGTELTGATHHYQGAQDAKGTTAPQSTRSN